MRLGPIKTTIEREGQRYVDDPVFRFIDPKKAAQAVAQAFEGNIHTIKILERYDRVRLRWVKPAPG